MGFTVSLRDWKHETCTEARGCLLPDQEFVWKYGTRKNPTAHHCVRHDSYQFGHQGHHITADSHVLLVTCHHCSINDLRGGAIPRSLPGFNVKLFHMFFFHKKGSFYINMKRCVSIQLLHLRKSTICYYCIYCVLHALYIGCLISGAGPNSRVLQSVCLHRSLWISGRKSVQKCCCKGGNVAFRRA